MNDGNAESELDSILDFLDAPTPEEQATAEAFPRGGVAQGLERLRAKLLDLTNRNRLLNYRHPRASSLRVVNVGLQSVFTRITNGSKLVFEAVPDPPPREITHSYSDDENASTLAKSSAQEHAESVGWNTSFDLDPGFDPDDSTTLPVLHYLESLESITRKIGTAAKTSIE